MKRPPDSTPRPFATGLRYRYAFGVVLVGALLALHRAPPRLIGAPVPQAYALVLSDQARRYLALEYRMFPTELMGCMIGEVHGSVVRVQASPPQTWIRRSRPPRASGRGGRVKKPAGWGRSG